jgi:hypothetical protein
MAEKKSKRDIKGESISYRQAGVGVLAGIALRYIGVGFFFTIFYPNADI